MEFEAMVSRQRAFWNTGATRSVEWRLIHLKKLEQALEEQVQAQQKQVEALEWLRQIEAATRTSYTRARELVEAFEETGLESSLPTESVVEGADSPADTYRSIYAMLF